MAGLTPGTSTTRKRLVPLIAIAAIAVSALAGCATQSSGTDETTGSVAPVKNGASQVRIDLASGSDGDVCTLSSDTAKSGPVTFTVQNKDSAAITEVELQSQQRILGEKENLAPGLKAVSFTVTLGGGSYQLYCPGAKKDLQKFTVTGKATATATGDVQSALKSGISGYSAYVTQEINNMVDAVAALKTAVDSGDVQAAQTAYAQARPYYERVESDVDGFILPGSDPTSNAGNLDYLIDMRASNLDDAVGWHGFHAVERDIFGAGITDSTKQLADELNTNVKKLDELSKGLTYKPEDLANGASDLLEEVQANKITGEEEDYSHIDLLDFAANVEGAQQAFAYLKPGLTKIDSDLTKTITSQFDSVTTLLDGYKDPSSLGGYQIYTDAIKAADAPKLSAAVEALHENLAKIAEKVATA